jgi:hypothetical protein
MSPQALSALKGLCAELSEAGHTDLYNVYIVYEEQNIAPACPTTAVPVSLAMDRRRGCLVAHARGCSDGGKCGGG